MNEEDLKYYKGFKSIVEKASFDLEGRAVITAAVLFKWFNSLEDKIEEAMKNKVEILDKSSIEGSSDL